MPPAGRQGSLSICAGYPGRGGPAGAGVGGLVGTRPAPSGSTRCGLGVEVWHTWARAESGTWAPQLTDGTCRGQGFQKGVSGSPQASSLPPLPSNRLFPPDSCQTKLPPAQNHLQSSQLHFWSPHSQLLRFGFNPPDLPSTLKGNFLLESHQPAQRPNSRAFLGAHDLWPL